MSGLSQNGQGFGSKTKRRSKIFSFLLTALQAGGPGRVAGWQIQNNFRIAIPGIRQTAGRPLRQYFSEAVDSNIQNKISQKSIETSI
jgi:hypothetical protein